MHHIVNQALGNHCHLAHTPMSFIILVRQEQSLIVINIYMEDSVNCDKVILLIVNLSMHFYCISFLLSVHASSHLQTAS